VSGTNKKNIIRVGYTAPSWPLNHIPNGIGTYVQNLLVGLSNEIQPVVLTETIIDTKPGDDLIHIPNFARNSSSLQILTDKVLYRLKFSCSQSIAYHRWLTRVAHDIASAIQQSKIPLDILEMEETFGVANYLIKISNVPVVTRLHGPWFLHGPIMQMDQKSDYKVRVCHEGKGIEAAHGVTSPSLDVLEKVRQYYDIALPHAKVIPNPVCEVGIQDQWQYNPNNAPFILVVGRFDLHKGGDLALEAFRLVASKNKDIELVFVGPDRGVAIEGKTFHFNQYIEQFIPEATIKNRIRFLGSCSHDQISDLRKNSLVTVICSRYENFPLSLLEALATGCPTIATAVGGMKEIVLDGYNGLLAEPSPDGIAEKLLELIDDPIKMQLLSKNAIADCKKRFSPEVVAAQTIDYYKSVIARSSNA
jgi:glycosyltransferase involved in cell wall biosynthesis